MTSTSGNDKSGDNGDGIHYSNSNNDTSSMTPASAVTSDTANQITTKTTTLTTEQRERIRKNRERALKIQAERKRKLETTEKQKNNHQQQQLQDQIQQDLSKRSKTFVSTSTSIAATSATECEEWELGASEWVSKKEAVSKYCLPEGTLAVCEVSEKDNPHHKGWTTMKLFRRSELRERAYKRYGGKDGLIRERNKREQRRLAKDMKEAENIFK